MEQHEFDQKVDELLINHRNDSYVWGWEEENPTDPHDPRRPFSTYDPYWILAYQRHVLRWAHCAPEGATLLAAPLQGWDGKPFDSRAPQGPQDPAVDPARRRGRARHGRHPISNEPYNVVVTTDHDCDGIGTGFHRYVGEPDIESAVAVIMEAHGGYCPMGVSDGFVMTGEEFVEKVMPKMSAWDLSYWTDEGYHGHFSRRWW